MTKPATVAGERIKSFIERVERLIEERQAIQSDIRDVFSEAKGVGYDVKTLRKLVQLRAIDAADRGEAAALLDTYANAIGMDLGQTVAEPSEEDLIEKASRIVTEVDRCMALVSHNSLPKIEAIKELIGCSTGKAHKLRGMVEKRLGQFSLMSARHRENENPEPNAAPRLPEGDERTAVLASASPRPVPEGGVGTGITNGRPAAAIAAGEAATVAIDAPAASGLPLALDDLAIPGFLDRRATA